MTLKRFRRFLFGAPLSSHKTEHTLLPKILALPVFASDAISSVAYATQQIVLVVGGAGLWILAERERYTSYTLLISALIVLLLTVVVTSYWQTIFGYPSGGGSYIVSKDNLGEIPGLIAAAALLIDYVLTVAVSIAAGVQNLASIPFLRAIAFDHHLVLWCLIFIIGLTIASLRGLKESGAVFAIFTYGFVLMCYLMIGIGIVGPWFGWQFDLTEVNSVYNSYPGGLEGAKGLAETFGIVVLLRAFANGCSAMTGTEAVSNGVPAFKGDKARNAALTLVAMGILLGTIFIGISWMAMQFHVVYYQESNFSAPAVIDQISGAVFGKSGAWSIGYLLTQFFTAAILVLAANTAFADFPRLASFLARDRYLPRQLSSLGDKLVFHNGIVVLGVCAAVLIIDKGGYVDALIPLYAIGVFLAFTLSQAGMVVHWFKLRTPGWRRRVVINGIGAVSTFVVLNVILIEKFMEGAWVVVILLGLLVWFFKSINHHYRSVSIQLRSVRRALQPGPSAHTVLLLISGVHDGIIDAINYAKSIAADVRGVYIEIDPAKTARMKSDWEKLNSGFPLAVLKSPFRSITSPLFRYLRWVRRHYPTGFVTVIIPEFVPPRWWHGLLHGHTGLRLKLALMDHRGIVVSNLRYHLVDDHEAVASEEKARPTPN